MTKELIDKVWSLLPKEFKEEVKEIYLNAVVHHPCGYNHKTDLMKYLFGHHNLTSDSEGEAGVEADGGVAKQICDRFFERLIDAGMLEKGDGDV